MPNEEKRGSRAGEGRRGRGAGKAGGLEGPAAGLSSSKNARLTIEAAGSDKRGGATLPRGSVCPGQRLTGLTLPGCVCVACYLASLVITSDSFCVWITVTDYISFLLLLLLLLTL